MNPLAKSSSVMASDQLAGNFSHPIRLEINIFDPMKINTIDKAYFRYANLAIIEAKAK